MPVSEEEKYPCGISITRDGPNVRLLVFEPCSDEECPDYSSGECAESVANVTINPEFARELAFLLTTKSYEAEG